MEKVCTCCHQKKPIELFRIKKQKEKYISYSICKDCEREYNKKYRERNKEKNRLRMKKWREQNKDHIKAYNLDWEQKNKEYRLRYHKEYNANHKEERRILDNICKKRKKQTDPIYKMKCQIRTMITTCFVRKKIDKNSKTRKIVGCDYETLANYLLKTFEDNYGYEWDGIEKVDIDHKTPLATAKTEEEVIKLCHYTNLQLLKHLDNIKKSDKLNWKLEEIQ